MSIYFNSKKFTEQLSSLESEFETIVFKSAAQIFGKDSILVDLKTKINSGELGKTIPDGFLFDFSDLDDPRFFLVEVELRKHDFYRHIFPQITKFFAFIKGNIAEQSKLVDSLYRVIESSEEYKKRFKSYLRDKELFKFLRDLIENSGEILLVIDGKKPEIDEIMLTYSDTWGKYVKLMVVKVFKNGEEYALLADPDFEIVENTPDAQGYDEVENEKVGTVFGESYHLSDCQEIVKDIYFQIKEAFPNVRFNSQHYYISMINESNFSFIKIRKKHIRIVVMVAIHEVKKYVTNYHCKEPSIGVQKFYNGACTEIKIDSLKNFKEVVDILNFARNFEIVRLR